MNLLTSYMSVKCVPNLFLLLCLGKSYDCQDSEVGSCATYTHSFKRTLLVSLASLEAEHISSDFHIYLPYFGFFLLTGLLVLIRIPGIDVYPRQSYRCSFQPLSNLESHRKVEVLSDSPFFLCFPHTLQRCWLLRSWLTHTDFTISGSLARHTFLVNSHDLAFPRGHLGQSVFGSKH